MKYDFKLTKNPGAGKIKTMKGAKRVFNLDGDLLCFLKKGRLYDLNAKVIAPCVSVKGLSEEEIAKTRGYCEDGKKVYFCGEETGIIEKRDRFIAILIFFILLTLVAIVAMSVATCIAEKNKVKEVTIIDKDGRWEADAKLDIFGDELLKPGAKGEYLFVVHNPNAFRLKCDIKICSLAAAVLFPYTSAAAGIRITHPLPVRCLSNAKNLREDKVLLTTARIQTKLTPVSTAGRRIRVILQI